MATLAAVLPARADPSTETITVDVGNLRTSQGWELCALYSSVEGFPFDRSKAVQYQHVPIQAGQAVCQFSA
jgi:uncharacterized protein (DUF2141 family)